MPKKSHTCALVAASEFNADHFRVMDAKGEFGHVLAVDGGFAHLQGIGRTPDFALGDFDSLGYVPSTVDVEVHPAHKDESDLELALARAFDGGCREAWVYGALGGRLDHTVAAVQMCACYAERGMGITLVGMDCQVRIVVGPATYNLPRRESGTVSVFALTPEAHGVVERGLEYSFDDETIDNRTIRGLSNEMAGRDASVSVREGTLLVFHPL